MEILHASGQVVTEPEIRLTKFTKDFSWGFYCTTNYRQARKWAKRRRGTPTINYYHYEENPSLKILKFTKMTDEWLEFIANCRNGADHDYDIVEGPMADDDIWDWVKLYLSGRMSREAFFAQAKFDYPTHQICFCTVRALRCLTYERSETVND